MRGFIAAGLAAGVAFLSTASALTWRAACMACHPEQASAWQRSRHAVAFTNTAFQVSWTRTPSATSRR